MEKDCECQSSNDNGLAMNAEQAEMEEAAQYKDEVVQKMESWLRAHFDGRSAGVVNDGAIEELLFQVGKDWIINRGIPANSSAVDSIVRDAAKEALGRYGRNWKGKVQGTDDRSHNFGKKLNANLKNYSV